jgi:hypothetical protein
MALQSSCLKPGCPTKVGFRRVRGARAAALIQDPDMDVTVTFEVLV